MTVGAERPGRPMRRSERAITDQESLDEIIQTADVLFLALQDEPAPYVVPVCFGIERDTLYVHSALEGKKIDLLLARPDVGFSACTPITIVTGSTPCDFSAAARSVVGTGRARIVEDEEERREGLDSIMRHYEGGAAGRSVYRPASLARTSVIAIRVDTLHGKNTGELPAVDPIP
jgi:nitroimidazol reductase NimA-like FMN-containing flavoprotein (pyridoxamine 5'-phosphate oxidase superfamily)